MNCRAFLSIAILFLILASCTTIEQKTPKIERNSPSAAYKKAEISMKYDFVDEAIKYLNEALSINPDHFPSCYLLGVALLKKGSLLKTFIYSGAAYPIAKIPKERYRDLF